MKAGYLSQYFNGVAIKTLSAVEADPYSSHQHEFNGVSGLKSILGKVQGKAKFDTKFIYLTDNEDEPVTDEGFLTWYDARERNPKRSEYRLYFPTTQVSMCAAAGDLLVIGLRPDNSVLVVIAEKSSTIGSQIKWLFGFSGDTHPGFSVRGELESEQDKLAFASRLILEQIGISVEYNESNYLDEMLNMFGSSFPRTYDFSKYARSTLKDVSPLEDPDTVFMAWIEREEILFRTLEKYLIGERLSKGFDDDVEGFISFSLSVQNRRKSRVGYAVENHLEEIFSSQGVNHSRGKVTENKSKPDFLFPNIENYHDISFDPSLLTMLGVKSSCKDRWRQVLSEADRIEHKHLFTLEAAISENQTKEMRERKLQLVLPKILHATYTPYQQAQLMDMRNFINLVKERQRKSL